jgi:hypothetical protein
MLIIRLPVRSPAPRDRTLEQLIVGRFAGPQARL